MGKVTSSWIVQNACFGNEEYWPASDYEALKDELDKLKQIEIKRTLCGLVNIEDYQKLQAAKKRSEDQIQALYLSLEFAQNESTKFETELTEAKAEVEMLKKTLAEIASGPATSLSNG